MNRKRSNEPVVWALFGAGGMVTALILPSLLAVLLVVSILNVDALNYQYILQLSHSWFGRLIWLVIIALPVWHALHRLFHLSNDFQMGYTIIFRVLCYGGALLLTVSVFTLVLAIP